jgi:ElaB/YqjD/DUF883 family membrane-anchored ribosome-binding protein
MTTITHDTEIDDTAVEKLRDELHLLAVHVGSLLASVRGRADEQIHNLHEDIDDAVDKLKASGRQVTAQVASGVESSAASVISQATVVVDAAHDAVSG